MDDVRLSWGQYNVYEYLRTNGFAPLAALFTGVWPVPAGSSVGAVRRALDLLVARHHVLRTVYLDRAGRPVDPASPVPSAEARQRVLAPRPVPVREVVCEPDEVPALSQAVLASWRGYVCDPADPVSLRAVVVCTPAGAAAVVVGVSHLAVDLVGFEVLRDEFRAVLAAEAAGTVALAALPPVRQPCDLVAQEEGGRMRAASAAALAYFRTVLQDTGPAFLSVGQPRERMRTSAASVLSFTLAENAAVLARAVRSSVPMVLASLVMLVLAAYTGERRVLLRSLHTRRHLVRGAAYVAPQVLPTLLCLDLPDGAGIADLLRLGRQSALAGYQHVDYDPAALLALEAQRSRALGTDLGGYCLFNFVGPAHRPGASTRMRGSRPQAAVRTGPAPVIPWNLQFRLSCWLGAGGRAVACDLQISDDLLGVPAAVFLERLAWTATVAAGEPDAPLRPAARAGVPAAGTATPVSGGRPATTVAGTAR